MAARRALRAPRLGLLLAALTLVLGCSDRPERRLLPTGLRGVPIDSTSSGDIVEGDIEAFGFYLPRDVRVTAKLRDTVYAIGALNFEGASNYVRERVLPGQVDTGPSKTVFRDAALKRDPSRRVLIEVRTKNGRVEMVVRDRTPQPAEPGLSESERWNRAGLTPDGDVIEKTAK
jgi:hypothetical protein